MKKIRLFHQRHQNKPSHDSTASGAGSIFSVGSTGHSSNTSAVSGSLGQLSPTNTTPLPSAQRPTRPPRPDSPHSPHSLHSPPFDLEEYASDYATVDPSKEAWSAMEEGRRGMGKLESDRGKSWSAMTRPTLSGRTSSGNQPSPSGPALPNAAGMRPPVVLPGGAVFRGANTKNIATELGTISYPNNATYTGDVDVHDRLPNGMGFLKSADGALNQRGQWVQGHAQGPGCQKLPKGYVFDGMYRDDVACGPGLLTGDGGNFMMRSVFDGGVPHGLTHVRFSSGDGFIGTCEQGRLSARPGVVRYADGRCAVRVTLGDLTHLVPVSPHADLHYSDLLLQTERAVIQEDWPAVLTCYDKAKQARRDSTASLTSPTPAWSLVCWKPNLAHFEALQSVLKLPSLATGPTRGPRRDLIRGLLHLSGPARPYRSFGEIETLTQHIPDQAYPDQLAFVAHTILPYYGTTRIWLGDSSQLSAGEVVFPYIFDGQSGFSERFSTCVQQLNTVFTEGYNTDVRRNDPYHTACNLLLEHVLDPDGHLDARQHGLRRGLDKAELSPILSGATPAQQVSTLSPQYDLPPQIQAFTPGSGDFGATRTLSRRGTGGARRQPRPPRGTGGGLSLFPKEAQEGSSPRLLPTTYEVPSPTGSVL